MDQEEKLRIRNERIEKFKCEKLTPEAKRAMLLAGGSVKTKYPIDAQLICREVRGKA